MVRKRIAFNTAQLYPNDLAGLHLAVADRVRICSTHGCVGAMFDADETPMRGVAALALRWGTLRGKAADYASQGSNVNRLVSGDDHIQSINAMARGRAFPSIAISIEPHEEVANVDLL